jgi:hypothetical protein
MATDERTAEALATAPAATMRNLYAAIGQALADAAQNAVAVQQQGYVTALASTTQGVATMYALDTATLVRVSEKEIGKQGANEAH